MHCFQTRSCRVFCWGIISLAFLATSVRAADKGNAAPTVAKKEAATKAVLSLLKSKSEQSWPRGVASLTMESLDDDRIVNALISIAHRETVTQRFTPALVQVITCLGQAKQPAALDELTVLLNDKDYRVVMAAADIVSKAHDRDFLEPLLALPKRSEYQSRYGFRRCVVDAVARFKEKSALEFLLDRLENSDGQLKYEIALSLERTTGQQFGGKADQWRRWWSENSDNFVFVSRTEDAKPIPLEAPPKPIPWDEARPSFYGMTIYAKRVVFVIDRSGSMCTTINNESRLARAQQELRKAIRGLSENDFFNIVAFDDQMEVFQTKLVQATDANKSGGIQFSERLVPRGQTACYEPLKMALEADHSLELILFLSDGEPNSGALPDPPAIVIAITNHNLTQRTTINALGIDARGSYEFFLMDLAERNSGKLLLLR